MKALLRKSLRYCGFELRNLRPFPRDDWVATCANLRWRHPLTNLLDVGANVGQTSLRLHTHFPTATIHAFEPSADTYADLKANVRHHALIHPHRFALGDRAGSASLVHADDSQLHTLRPLASHEGGEREPVQVETLDGFVATHALNRIDLLKTDTEGFDAQVLRGAAQLFARQAVAAVLSEFTLVPSNRTHTQLADLNAILYPAGFRLYDLYDLSHWDHELQYGNALYVHPAHLAASA